MSCAVQQILGQQIVGRKDETNTQTKAQLAWPIDCEMFCRGQCAGRDVIWHFRLCT
jgi:hypothetical protein